MSETEVPDCPLCMETFEIDDINFFPCTCGYQVCRFCWHRIRTDENGLCPACRKAYSEDPAMYRPLSQDELQKIKKERKQKEVQQKQKTTDSRQHLANIRVIQKHLVFVVGLSNKMADPEVLKRQEYFGKYGKILKIVINPNTNYAGPQGPSASAYVTYSKEEEALRTILSINNMQPPLKIRSSLGTTKYCTHYLRNTVCPKMDCMYLHDLGDMNASFTKEDMQAGKHQLFEKDLLDNYAASVQKARQSHSHSQLTTNHHGVSEDAQAWSEGENDNTPMLPSNASWASVRDEKDKKPDPPKSKSRNNSMSIDYPSIEAASSRVSAPVLNSGGRERKDSNSVSSNDKSNTTTTKHSRKKSSVEKIDVTDNVFSTSTATITVVTTSTTSVIQPPPKTEDKKNKPPSPPPVPPTQTITAPPPGITKPVDPQTPQVMKVSPTLPSNIPSSIPTTSTSTASSLPSLTLNDVTTTTVTTTTTSITSTASATTSYPWPGSIDLGLSDLQIQANDDELGFDPFKESKSGLEDLIATERKQAQVTSTTNSTDTKPIAAFSWDSFWPTNFPQNGTQPAATNTNMAAPGMMAPQNHSYSLFNPEGGVGAQSPNNPYDIQNKPLANTMPTAASPKHDPSKMSAYPFRFATSPHSAHPPPPGHPLSQYMQQQQQIYGQRFPFQQPTIPSPGQAQPLHSFITPSTTAPSAGGRPSATVNPSVNTSVDKNWQDGLRALLPNINISFASNWNNTPGPQQQQPPPAPGLNADHPSSPTAATSNPLNGSLAQQVAATSQQQQTQQSQQQTPVVQSSPNVANVASPPPGFGALLGNMESVKNKPPSSWPDRDEQPKPQPPTQAPPQTRIPPPPPGFRSPVATVAAEPFVTTPTTTSSSKTASTTNNILTTVAATHTTSSAKAIPQPSHNHQQQQQQNKRHSQHYGSHEDPSILWSKVLSDKPTREIETTSMLFPLPGETVDQALSSASLPATPPQNNQQSHLMSWNSVVSGNQYGKSPTSRDMMEPCTVNTKDTKDNTSQKPQKPSPIFGNQQKNAVKKPTAHVKPLKCNPPNDGFTTVHNSSTTRANTQNQQTVDANLHTGSRVSELDDFSADLPSNVNVNLTANIVSNSIVDYPPVAAQVSGNPSSKSKKKKRKGKEQPGLVSEVVVGFATSVTLDRPPPLESTAIVDDERPTKKKNKKKNKSNSVSPPSQRKSADNTSQEKSKDHFRGVMKVEIGGAAQAVAGSSSFNPQQQQLPTSHEHDIAVSRLTESTEKLLKNVLFETEAIKLNTEQISKDLKSALEKCKESSLSLSDLEKINLLLTPGKIANSDLDDPDLVDTTDLERQVESARREAKLLEARLNDVIRKNMASELETLKRNTKSS